MSTSRHPGVGAGVGVIGAVCIGPNSVLFGMAPAARAVGLDTDEALRHEWALVDQIRKPDDSAKPLSRRERQEPVEDAERIKLFFVEVFGDLRDSSAFSAFKVF
jgi:hypothetical protein